MSFQWLSIAYFLYAEITVVIFLLLPFISTKRWSMLFKSSFMRSVQQKAYFWFNLIFGILTLCLFDAIREMMKYNTDYDGKAKQQQYMLLELELRNSRLLFRAQRNFYITGFSLLLVFVIRRLTILIATQAMLSATSEAALKQAESASKAAKDLMSKNDEKEGEPKVVPELEKKLKQLNEELEKAKKERATALKDLEAIKFQSKGTNRKYDRLIEEHNKLQKKLAILGGDGSKSDKKAD